MIYKKRKGAQLKGDVQLIGEELDRLAIRKPSTVVEAARDPDSELHAEFEWNDKVAGPKYREIQAGQILRAIVIEVETVEKSPAEVRAFIPVESDNSESSYEPVSCMLTDESIALKEIAQQRKRIDSAVQVLTSTLRYLNNNRKVTEAVKQIAEGAQKLVDI